MIKPKIKPCKGTGKAIGYGCGKLTDHRQYGLGKMCGCYSDWLLNSEEGKIKMAKTIFKVQKPRLYLERAEAERKENKSIKALLSLAKVVCHQYIRERDKGRPCISCGKAHDETFQAGHFYKAELFSNIRFDEMNISVQCRVCNLYKDGNPDGYRQRYLIRYGKEALASIDEKAQEYKGSDFKWDSNELKKIISYYREKTKELKIKKNETI